MKNIFIPAVFAAILMLGSCSDWTKTESLDMRPLTPEQQNPGKYNAYLASLREYKESNHYITIVNVSGMSGAPFMQNQHLTSVADSVDIVCMSNIAGLHPTIAGEMRKVRGKGMRLVCMVDYMTIQNEWVRIKGEETEEEITIADLDADEFAAYCKEQTELVLSDCDKYGFDGIEISYLGRAATEPEKKGQETFMDCIETWRATNHDRMMLFRGYLQNLEDNTILDDCDYIVILAGTFETASQLTREILRKMLPGVPTDRFVIEVAIPSISDPVQEGATPQVAANWVAEEDAESRFLKAGLAVANAQDDYFNTNLIYRNIREAIGIMNPTSNN